MSHFLYIHKDLSGNKEWNKVGQAITPYSAVRLRQRFCSEAFYLDHLYFGRERHIEMLEWHVKQRYGHFSGKSLTGMNQTELFKVPQTDLVIYINSLIQDHKYDIRKIELKNPYSASSSGNCPLGVPSEKLVFGWAQKLVKNAWGESEEEIILKRLWVGN